MATRPEPQLRQIDERSWPVATVPAALVDVRPQLSVYGEIVAGRKVDLRPLVPGRIIETGASFVDGGSMRAGDLIIAIDPFDFESTLAERRAELAEARARHKELTANLEGEKRMQDNARSQLDLAEADVVRRENLIATGHGSQKALDDARLARDQRQESVITSRQALDMLAARIDQAAAAVDRLKVGVSRARRDLEKAQLRAPFDGFLLDTEGAVGKQVNVNDRVARLIDAGWLEARFLLANYQFERLLAAGDFVGTPAQVIWRLGHRTFEFAAVIERAESRIDAASGGVLLYARLKDTGLETVLRPGAFVEVRVPEAQLNQVIRVPESALHRDGGDAVFVVRDGRLERRSVTALGRDGGDYLVRGQFVDEDLIVTTRFPEMAPGLRVTVP